MNKMKNKEDEFKKYLEETKNIEANADEQVLKFIFDFVNLQGTPESVKAIYNQFESGYCYYFAVMLQAAFNRGTVCWHRNYSHIVWKDCNEVAYDVGGVFYDYNKGDLLPVEESLGELLTDFKHNGEEVKIENTKFVNWAKHYGMTPVYAITDIYKRFASNHKIGYNATIVNTVLDYWGSHKNELGLFYAGKKHNNPEYEEMISMDVF